MWERLQRKTWKQQCLLLHYFPILSACQNIIVALRQKISISEAVNIIVYSHHSTTTPSDQSNKTSTYPFHQIPQQLHKSIKSIYLFNPPKSDPPDNNMHFQPLTLLTLLSAGALALPTTLNVTLSITPRDTNAATIGTFTTKGCQGPSPNLKTESPNGDCISISTAGVPFVGIHWGTLGAQGDGIGITAFKSNDCSGKYWAMMMKGKPDDCIELMGDTWGSVKIRHEKDGKAQGPWIHHSSGGG